MIVDTNVYLSRWPFRRLAGDETPELVERLRRRGVTEAWVGSFDGLLHKDIAAVNARLAADCLRTGDGFLVPFGSINPKLPDWQEDLRRCHEEHRMPGIRLHPNYHGYGLDDPAFAEILHAAAERGLLVQLVLKMEDERTQHPLLRVPTVDTASLPKTLQGTTGLRLMIVNGLRDLRGDAITRLASAGAVSFEIAMLEGVGAVAGLIKQIGVDRVLFGSYFPFFTFEAAALKLKEAGLRGEEAIAIESENARRRLGRR